ncbi:MAG TPA: alpha/beta hydrolase [Reyranella sp.]|nr:alpha/beta hydrolase [Reyranella sp.]
MKRRALLLATLLIAMPSLALAKPKKKKAKQAARKPPLPMQPVKDGKSQLVAFNASAFPYRGAVPDSKKPFLDKRSGKRRGHTTSRGDVYWEDTTYSDRRSLLYIPPGFDANKPSLIVIYLHGQGATLERDVAVRQAVPRQLAESGKNVVLAAPQLALDATDSSAGNFWRPGHFAKYLDEAAERLMRLHGDKRAGETLNAAPVVLVAYSGGYLPTAYSLAHGGAAHRVRGVILMDALYGEADKFARWAGRRRRQSFLFSAYTDSTKDENATLQRHLARHRIPLGDVLPMSLAPGTFAFAPCGGLSMHGDFVTRAWQPDPLKHAISLIPGFDRHGRKRA